MSVYTVSVPCSTWTQVEKALLLHRESVCPENLMGRAFVQHDLQVPVWHDRV